MIDQLACTESLVHGDGQHFKRDPNSGAKVTPAQISVSCAWTTGELINLECGLTSDVDITSAEETWTLHRILSL